MIPAPSLPPLPSSPDSRPLPRFCIGLTGGIGSGKSTVADLFAELGAGIVDADLIAHALTASDGAAIPAIRSHFGSAALTGDNALDRNWMRERAFTDPDSRIQLERILHPLIRDTMQKQITASSAPYVLLVIPLLLEKSGWREQVQRILVIDIAPSLQIDRVMQRSQLSRSRIEAIMAVQLPRLNKVLLADDVLCNDREQSDLHRKTALLHRFYMTLAQGTQENRQNSNNNGTFTVN